MKIIITTLLLITPLTSFGNTLDVGCHLGSFFSEPAIKFAGVTGSFNPDNYGKTGTVAVTAELTTKLNKVRKFSIGLSYKKIGERLEFTKVGSEIVRFNSEQITREEFKEIFGPLPKLKCYVID